MDKKPDPSAAPAAPEAQDENHVIAERRAKLKALREAGNPYPNGFRRLHLAAELHRDHGAAESEALEAQGLPTRIAGRMMLKRVMGKASFATLQDGSGSIQIYVTDGDAGVEAHQAFKHWDIGDILGVEGTLFKTRKGELTVRATALHLLSKSLRPLPEKHHGLTDQEQRYRQRYLDLISNEDARRVFTRRTRIVQAVRDFFVAHGYLEVETPMMHPIPGGAAARPFVTHHNTLDAQLYLRIAPELYLKRLIVGGFERVFEINRNFRNEGISTRHNPEFTMIEFYAAYQDYHYLMDLIEALLRDTAQQALGSARLTYQGREIDFTRPFARVSIAEAIARAHPGLAVGERAALAAKLDALGIAHKAADGLGALQLKLFEETVESTLFDPVFIHGYPAEVSPLARRSDDDATLTDRFELFIAGREIANGFSELNDPEDQAARFREQARQKEAGDAEAMHYDEDYVRALEYGMPPTAGAGIGIDRLVMLLTDSPSIRDVILFPQLRGGR